MSEEKITRLRNVFLKTLEDFFAEQKPVKNIRNLPEYEQIIVLMTSVAKIDDLLYAMCKLGISGAKIRGVSSEEIERFLKEEEEVVSKELRNSLSNRNLEKALFLITQFQLLQRKIIKAVASVLSPRPLYEFSREEAIPKVRNVFIVHGRDDKPRLELARMLEKLGFNAIILSEQPDKGRTLIEKLEQETIDIGYAFVILTPDDMGCLRDDFLRIFKLQKFTIEDSQYFPVSIITNLLRNRARQNVILELGYFVGKIGRNRVCCLYKGDVELPSDIHGVLFKKFDESVEECYKGIVEELKAAGYEIQV